MAIAMKCEICGNFEDCKKFVAIELWEYDVTNLEDNTQLESVDVCKKCLKDVKKLLKLDKKKKEKKK